MKKYLFIINPVAGKGKAREVESLIEETMNKNQMDFEIVRTTEPKEATSIAESFEYDVVVAVGGDGTVNEVVAGLANKEKRILGIMPVGTGNDFSRNLNIPSDPGQALDLILKGNTNGVEVGESNGHHFLNISSVGFDVEVLVNIDRIRKVVKGNIGYILSVIYTLMNFKKKLMTLEIDGRTYNRNLLLLAVGKGKYYGGGMMILPNAKLYDDYLYVCLVKDISNLRALTLFPLIFKGDHLKFKKYVEIHRAKKIKIINNSSLLLNIDGELLKEGDEIIFKLSNKKIQVIS